MRALLSVVALLGLAAQVQAQAPLTGDWRGRRTWLEQRGITLDINYVSEDGYNTRGGMRETFAHAGQLAFGARLDLEQLWGWDGMRAQVSLSHRDGENLNIEAGLGELLHNQETYGRGNIWRLGSLWLGKTFADGRFSVKAGRLAVGDDFNTLDCMAMNLTFCGSQPAMIVGDYWMNGPASQWGLALEIKPTAQTYLRAGAYQVNPSYAEEQGGGLRLAPSGTTGTLTPVEFGWDPDLSGLGGHYAIGGWYSSAPRQDIHDDIEGGSAALSGLGLAMRTGAYGGYLSAHQQFTQGQGGHPRSGLRGYFDVVQTDTRTGRIDRTVHLIAIYTGVGDRVNDRFGLGVGATHLNARYAASLRDASSLSPGLALPLPSGNEYTAELFYAWTAHGITLQPLLQYVVHPGGNAYHPDVMVVGMKTLLTF